MNEIHNEDCLEGMKRIPDKSVDIVITSPPYNLGKKHHTGGNSFKAYNSYDDNLPEREYQEWQRAILQECYRVLKDDGSLLYNHKNRIAQGAQISPYEWLLDTDFIMKQEIVWQNGSQNFDKIRFYPFTERIYWMAKSPKTKLFNALNHHDVFTKKEWPSVGTKGAFKRAFPESLVSDLLKCFPDAGVVLDPFMGSGTTAIAALNTDRKFIGFELDEGYWILANNRIAEWYLNN